MGQAVARSAVLLPPLAAVGAGASTGASAGAGGAGGAGRAAAGEAACGLGVWDLQLRASRYCDFLGCDADSASITFSMEGHSCMRFQVRKVDSCGEHDLKCRSGVHDCGPYGVLRLETTYGELVDPGTADGMLSCGNQDFTVSAAHRPSSSSSPSAPPASPPASGAAGRSGRLGRSRPGRAAGRVETAALVRVAPSGRLLRTAERPSLFCFALSSQRLFELRLLALQRRHGLGVFSCNEHQIFSNSSSSSIPIEQGEPPLVTTLVLGNRSIGVGWMLNTLNTGVFMNVWKRIFFEKRYRRHDWVVKLDPDAVFFPDQLRHVLRRHCCGHCGSRKRCGEVHFRQNYTHGRFAEKRLHYDPLLFDGAAMFGPLEVFSSAAVDKFNKFFSICKYEVSNRKKPELWGDHWSLHEDIFLDRCMFRIGVAAHIEHRLLQENGRPRLHEGRWPLPCEPGSAAYHPYKGTGSYLRCQSEAALRRYRDVAPDTPSSSPGSDGGGATADHVCSLFGPAPPAKGWPLGCPQASVGMLRALV